MKKIGYYLASALMCVMAVAMLTGCKNDSSKQIEAMLNTVPDNAAFVAVFDGNNAIEELGIKEENGKWTYCTELKELLNEAGADSKDMQEALDLVMNTSKACVVFSDEYNVWVTFRVENEKEFLDFEKSKSNDDIEKVDGVTMLDRTSALKDNQVWICTTGRCSADDINRYASMDEKKSFMHNNKFAAQMASGEFDASAILNINEVMAMLRKLGTSKDAAMIQTGMSMLWDDASYATLTCKMKSDGLESYMEVLNSEFKPAKFNLPVGSIDMAALGEIKGETLIAGGVALPNALAKKLAPLAASLADPEMAAMLEDIDGTASIGANTNEDASITISFKTESAARNFYNAVGNTPDTRCDMKNNMVTIYSRGMSGRGGASEKLGELKGAIAGMVTDFSQIPVNMTYGTDLSKLGYSVTVLEKVGDGVRLKNTWKMKDPAKTILEVIGQFMAKENAAHEAHMGDYVDFTDSNVEFEEVTDSMAYAVAMSDSIIY